MCRSNLELGKTAEKALGTEDAAMRKKKKTGLEVTDFRTHIPPRVGRKFDSEQLLWLRTSSFLKQSVKPNQKKISFRHEALEIFVGVFLRGVPEPPLRGGGSGPPSPLGVFSPRKTTTAPPHRAAGIPVQPCGCLPASGAVLRSCWPIQPKNSCPGPGTLVSGVCSTPRPCLFLRCLRKKPQTPLTTLTFLATTLTFWGQNA